MAATIETLAHALDNAPDYSVGTLERILLENLPSPEEVVALADTSMPYGRTILRLNDKYEMIIGCWPRNGWCDAHDHGDAEGVVYGCSGEVEHFDYRFNGDTLELYEQSTIKNGQHMRLPKDMIHSLANVTSDEPYVGLHIYSPAATNVRVFDTRNGDIYHVTDDAASVVPRDEAQIRMVERGKFSYRNLVKEQQRQTQEV
ncbi:MAG: cysteine dioxygenase family protein [Bacteroidetes bacterium]|nr:cysteine dioxygenase family protein [Bacteroidota bacterium]